MIETVAGSAPTTPSGVPMSQPTLDPEVVASGPLRELFAPETVTHDRSGRVLVLVAPPRNPAQGCAAILPSCTTAPMPTTALPRTSTPTSPLSAWTIAHPTGRSITNQTTAAVRGQLRPRHNPRATKPRPTAKRTVNRLNIR